MQYTRPRSISGQFMQRGVILELPNPAVKIAANIKFFRFAFFGSQDVQDVYEEEIQIWRGVCLFSDRAACYKQRCV